MLFMMMMMMIMPCEFIMRDEMTYNVCIWTGFSFEKASIDYKYFFSYSSLSFAMENDKMCLPIELNNELCLSFINGKI